MTDDTFERRLDGRLVASMVAAGSLSFSAVVFETAMNVAMPTLMSEFGVGTATVQWITSGYLLTLAACIPTFSFLKARFPMRALFVTAVALFTAGALASGLAPAFWVLLAGRLLQGVGTGIALPLMFNIVVDQVPYDKTGMMMGFATMITSIAPAIGPSYGGLIMSVASWRMVFLSFLPLLLAALVMGGLCIRQATRLTRPSFDAVGFALLCVAFFSLIFGINSASGLGWAHPRVVGLLAACVVACALFCVRSLRSPSPLINVRAFCVPGFTTCVLAVAGVAFMILGFAYIIPNFGQLALGADTTTAGILLLPGSIANAVFAVIGGRLLDRHGPVVPVTAGALVLLASCSLFAASGDRLDVGSLIGYYTLFGVGEGLAFSNLMTVGLRRLPAADRTDGNSIFNTLQQLGGSVGVSVVTTVVAASQAGSADLAASTAAGGERAFAVLAVVSAAVLALSVAGLALLRRRAASPASQSLVTRKENSNA